MKAARVSTVVILVLLAARAAQMQSQPPQERDKPENYSPLGFEDLRAYQQAYPGSPDSLAPADPATFPAASPRSRSRHHAAVAHAACGLAPRVAVCGAAKMR